MAPNTHTVMNQIAQSKIPNKLIINAIKYRQFWAVERLLQKENRKDRLRKPDIAQNENKHLR